MVLCYCWFKLFFYFTRAVLLQLAKNNNWLKKEKELFGKDEAGLEPNM